MQVELHCPIADMKKKYLSTVKNNKNTGVKQRKSKRDANKIKWSEVILKK